jgi:hypothetical protein
MFVRISIWHGKQKVLNIHPLIGTIVILQKNILSQAILHFFKWVQHFLDIGRIHNLEAHWANFLHFNDLSIPRV